MSFLILFLILIFSLIIQCSILPYLSVFGVVGNIILPTVIAIALLGKKPYGGVMGVLLGLLQDILFSRFLGINALIYFAIGYILGNIDFHLSRDNLYMPVVLTSFLTIIYNLMYFIIIYFLGKEISVIYFVKNKLIIELVYNGILSIGVYKIVSRVFVAPAIRFYRE